MTQTKKTEETAELLIELYSEEIPWKLQEPMARNLEKFLQEDLAKALGLKKTEEVFGERRVYWTPRRVAVGIVDVPIKSKAWEEERKGPMVNSPRVAIEGFLKANKLSLEDCQQKEGYLVFVVKHAAVSTSDLLGEVVVRVIERMAKALPVSMRFGEQNFRWVRPLRHIMVVFAEKGVKGALELGKEEKLDFTNETRGHPFAAPDAIVVTGIQDYENKLRENYVEPNYQIKINYILTIMMGAPYFDYQTTFPAGHRLLEENSRLTEYPVILKGHFDEEFAYLPSLLINTVLGEHQKMIRDINIDHREREFFIITNAPQVKKGGEEENNIIKGFERVVRARLADAKFMFERDKNTPSEELIGKLRNITFHPKLGTIADKNQRTKKLIPIIVKELKNNNDEFSLDKKYDTAWFEGQVDKLKMDLATETVREFPSLHKIIGQELTGNIFDSKIFPPRIIVDIADNIDTLVSLWGVGAKPKGSGDPFALRRYSLLVIFCLIRNPLFEKTSLPLKSIMKEALDIVFAKDSDDSPSDESVRDFVLEEIVSFMLERLRVFMKDHEHLLHDCIEAVLAREEAQECNINLLYRHTMDLAVEITDDNPLAEIFHRLHAILRPYLREISLLSSPISLELFDTTEEKNLHARIKPIADEAWQNLTFQEKLKTLGNLKDAIDPFFERVLVMHKDERIRQNRLRLLYSIYQRFLELADFTKIHHKDKQQKHSPKQP